MAINTRVHDIQQYFERLYQEGVTPWTEHGIEPEIPALADRLLAENRASRLLDIGCGNGWLSIYFAQRGIEVDSIDSAPTAIAEAERHAEKEGVAERARFTVGDGLALPYADASFDAVFDRGFFHHVPEDHYEQYRAEVGRVLKPQGWLSLHAFTMNNPSGIGHRFEPEDIEQIFSEQFTLVEQSLDPWPTSAPAHLGHYLLRKQ